jgi:hypothetical protein
MSRTLISAIAAWIVATGANIAGAACLTKGAVATSGTEASAKWFAMETMVQAVDWGLWPGYVATSKVDGYKVVGEKYTCRSDGGGITCNARATFCKLGK